MSKMESVESIVVDGKTYVPQAVVEYADESYCIVRTYSAGVFAGNITRRDGQETEMINARRLWYWKGAASLSQLAIEGVKNPDECKFAMPVTVTLLQTIEILPCTIKAQKNIKGVFVWKI